MPRRPQAAAPSPALAALSDDDLYAALDRAGETSPNGKRMASLLAECLARAHAGNPALWANRLGNYAYSFVHHENWDAAIRIYEAAITLPCPFDLSLYCNALWVLQRDNTGRPVDPDRNARFLAHCLPHAPENPAIFFNAACLTHEMGDDEATLAHIEACLAHGYRGSAQIQNEPLLAPLRLRDPRFDALFAARKSTTKTARKTAKTRRKPAK